MSAATSAATAGISGNVVVIPAAPQGNGDKHPPHDDLTLVWEAVWREDPLIIEQITGPMRHPMIDLPKVIRTFHAQMVKLQKPLLPSKLVSMFDRWPEGGF